jgi:hypothetical protein
MPPRASRRIILTLVMIAVCVGIVQLDRTAATPRSAGDRLLATRVPSAGVIRPLVNSAVAPILSPPLRDIKPILPTDNGHTPLALPRPSRDRTSRHLGSASSDPVLQWQAGVASMPGTIRNFEGVNNVNNVFPPDAEGDVGPNHYVQWVNVSLAVWDKSGKLLAGPVNGNTFWAGVGGPCETSKDGEPIVLYDQLADRWFLSQVAYPNYPNGPYYQCIAVSTTSDPLGTYARYPFKLSDTNLNEDPKFGVWPDGYYMSIGQLANGTTWAGAAVYVFDREKMLQGQTTRPYQYFTFSTQSSFGGMLPADLDGPPPPAGTPNYFVEVDDSNFIPPDDALYLWQFHVDWNNPNNSTFGLQGQPNAVLPTAPFNLLQCAITYNPCIPQKGTSQKLDAIADRLMYRLQYRNFGDHQSLVVNHTVDIGGERAGIRWYEVRDPGGVPLIYQQGTYAPAGSEHRWMGSAAMDRQGNVAIGYSVSGSNTYPSIRYAGRLVSDPLGTLAQGEATLLAGVGSQTGTERWGDYTMLAVDPTDDCTFWYTNEYYSATTTNAWRTRIGSFRFPSCTGSPTGHLVGTVTNAANGTPVANATVRAGTNTTTTNSSGVYHFFNLPVSLSYSVTASATGFASKTMNPVSVTDRATTTKNFALQPTGGSPGATKALVPIIVKALPPTPTPTPTPRCDPYEPNDDRGSNPFGPLVSGQVYLAKLCHDDPEDNYYFVTATQNQIQITLHLPPSLVGHTLLWVYAQADLRQGHEICSKAPVSKADTVLLCSIPHPGGYDLRLYTDGVFDDQNSYSFAVSYQ